MDPPLDRAHDPQAGEAHVASSRGAAWRVNARMLVVVYLTFWAQFAWVKSTNFEGFDEWLLLSLTSRGIVSMPHANRPLQLIWHLPAAAIDPFNLTISWLLHGHYMALSGCLLVLILRRLLPAEPLLALLAGTLAVTWAPLDLLRLTTVYTVVYAGTTFGVVLAVFLLIEAHRCGNRGLLALACLTAFVTGRGYEAALAILAAAPLLLPLLPAPRRRRVSFAATWCATIALAGTLAAVPLFAHHDSTSYQRTMKPLDTNALHFASRMLKQYGHHLGPVFVVPRLPVPAAPLAALTFLALTWLARKATPESGPFRRQRLAAAMVAGLTAAGLGYCMLVLGTIEDPGRAQFFSSPGIGLALAAAILLLVSWAPPAARRVIAVACTAWLVASGTGRVVEKQEFWNGMSKFGPQRRVLRGIVERAPDVRPHTLVLLLDASPAWQATFGFRPAIELLYEGRATGYLLNRSGIFYPAWFNRNGMRCEPEPIIREPWRTPVTEHTYSEMIVFYADPSGDVRLLDRWQEIGLPPLPPLPPGARYEPRSRIVPLEGAAPHSRILIE